MVYTECNPTTCPCGELCSNQCIQRHQSVACLDKFLTHDRGYGVKTLKSLQAG